MAVFGWPDPRKLNRVAEEQRGTAALEKNARGLRPVTTSGQEARNRDQREVNLGILLPENRAKDPRF